MISKKIWTKDFIHLFRDDLKLFSEKWLADDNILFHGTNVKNDKSLKPNLANCESNLEGNFLAVYATNDIHLAIYYAILDKSKWKGYSISEKFISNGEWFYYFALEGETLSANPFTNGIINVVSRKNFTEIISDLKSTSEWYGFQSEIIIDEIEVFPTDFKFLNNVNKI